MLELVRGYATAALDAARRAERLDRTASDLSATARLLVSSESLRAALTDGAIPPVERVAVLRDLLGSKVTPEALAPIAYSIYNERSVELPKTVEQLVELAEEAASRAKASLPGGAEPPAGRSGAYERIRGYADHVFEQIANRKDVDAVEDELYRLARVAEKTPSLLQALADTAVPIEGRLGVLEDLLASRVRPDTARLAAYILRAGRSRSFDSALDYLVEIAAAERGRRIADVRSAVDLTADERQRLSAALAVLTRRPVELRVRLDPSAIGGLSVAVGDFVIDGTVRNRLAQLRETLLQSA
ncbi:MAG: ATP synthase F1 subunit delta [Acidimicrobiales bacterium]